MNAQSAATLTVSAADESAAAGCTETGPAPETAAYLFHHFVCRVAGLPGAAMDELRAAATAAALDLVAAAEATMERAGADLGEALFAAVGGCEDRARRSGLLALRRDVHNLRRPEPRQLEAARRALPPAAVAALDRYAGAAERHAGLLAELPELYAADLATTRRRFRDWVGDADLRKGLQLSSRTLSSGLERYLDTPAGELTAKERQIERGLLRYLSRMAMKTTPFGSFTALAPGRLVDGGADAGRPAVAEFDRDPRRKRSLVRLNKRLCGVVLGAVLADDAVRRRLDVELNSTLHDDGGRWRFLAADGEREAFRRLDPNPVIDLYRALLAAGPLPLGDLEARLVADPRLDADAGAVAAFTARLLDLGLLRLRTGVPPQEAEWDRPLRRLLAPIGGTAAAHAVGFLDRMRALCDGFAAAPPGERRRLIADAGRTMADAYEELARRSTTRMVVPFYEDAGTAARLTLRRGELAGAAASLLHYVRWTARLAWPRHLHVSMRHFYDGRYGGGAVPLLRFYEDYYREHFKDYLEREREAMRRAAAAPAGDGGEAETEEGPDEDGGRPAALDFDALNPFGLAPVEAMKAGNDRLTARYAERWRDHPDAEAIELSRADLERAAADAPPLSDPCFSTSVFAQLLPGAGPGGGTALLVSSLLRGFGKYYSRFLAALPAEVERDLRRNNDRLSGARLAEIASDGDFNGNLHPPLVAWEVSYPTVEERTPGGALRVTDLAVESVAGDPCALLLRHRPSGERVVPLDLGFQNPLLRPPLYQLLSGFAPAANYYLPAPETPAFDAAGAALAGGDEPRVLYRPRLVYDGWLVLGRRRWTVPRRLFPRHRGGESEADHFLRVDRWRRRHGLPREVFMSVQALPGAAGGGVRGDLHKPQYVDFANPLLVDLFSRATENLDRYAVRLYERLPAHDQLPRHGGRRYATELVLQVDFPGGLAP